MTEGLDVVGRADEDAAPNDPMPPALRLLVFIAVGLIAVAVLTRTDLLSSDGADRSDLPTPSPSVTLPTTTSNLVLGPPRPVARWNDALAVGLPDGVRADRPVLETVDEDSDLVAVESPPEPGAARAGLLGIGDGELVRIDVRSGEATRVAAATAVVDAAASPGRVLVLRDDRLLELDAGDGRITDDNPFPGFDPASLGGARRGPRPGDRRPADERRGRRVAPGRRLAGHPGAGLGSRSRSPRCLSTAPCWGSPATGSSCSGSRVPARTACCGRCRSSRAGSTSGRSPRRPAGPSRLGRSPAAAPACWCRSGPSRGWASRSPAW